MTKLRIAPGEPAPGCYAICLVIELFRPEFIKVLEKALCKKFRMQRSDAVDGKAADYRQVCHFDLRHLTVFYDRHPALTLKVVRPAIGYFCQEPGIDLKDNVEDAGQESSEKIQRPFFERFRQKGVVCVRHGLASDFPGTVPLQPTFVHEESHQFRYRTARMGIVELKDIFIGKFREISFFDHHPSGEDILETCRCQKI